MPRFRHAVLTALLLLVGFQGVALTAGWMSHYRGKPFEDSVYHGGPQKIPGRVQCAYYDLGGEGIAYHDSDAVNQGGTISLDRNGKTLTRPLQIVSVSDPAETVAWRQVHHWNLMKDIAEVKLPKGVSVLTLHILTEGNMNLAYLDFEPKGGHPSAAQ